MTKEKILNILESAKDKDGEIPISLVRKALEKLPDRKKGEWTERRVIEDVNINVWQYERCSVCGKYHTTPYLYIITDYAYCPHCGARMEEGGE